MNIAGWADLLSFPINWPALRREAARTGVRIPRSMRDALCRVAVTDFDQWAIAMGRNPTVTTTYDAQAKMLRTRIVRGS